MPTTRTTPLFSLINAAMRPALRSRRDPAGAWKRAVHQAEQRADVTTDATDATWLREFGFLIEQVAKVENLSPIGWVTTLTDARARLVNRLRIRSLLEQHPEIAEEPITKPIFVVGLPRTATTLAHRVLAGTAESRGPRLWEMSQTDLVNEPAVLARRVKRAARQYSATKWAPDFDHIHPIDVHQPEESMFLLPHGVYHLLFHAPMPAYRAWLAERDPEPDYAYLKTALQVLQHQRPKRRWVLKYPFDLGQMDTIRRVFPDATFVWTHRDPVTVAGSLCSLADLSQALFVQRPDRSAIGALAIDLMHEAVEAGRTFRQHHPEAVIDLPYYPLLAAPERTVPDLFERLDLTWTDADDERLAAALDRGRTARDRKHEYNLRDFGLSADDIETRFSDYTRWINAMTT